MLNDRMVLVFDIDGTICRSKKSDEEYSEIPPNFEVVQKMKEYKVIYDAYIILFTSRQMRTFQGNLGKINAVTAKEIFRWLDKYDIPYDEIYFGKPWCGFKGFYVDDKAIRPDEFVSSNYDEIIAKIGVADGK